MLWSISGVPPSPSCCFSCPFSVCTLWPPIPQPRCPRLPIGCLTRLLWISPGDVFAHIAVALEFGRPKMRSSGLQLLPSSDPRQRVSTRMPVWYRSIPCLRRNRGRTCCRFDSTGQVSGTPRQVCGASEYRGIGCRLALESGSVPDVERLANALLDVCLVHFHCVGVGVVWAVPLASGIRLAPDQSRSTQTLVCC